MADKFFYSIEDTLPKNYGPGDRLCDWYKQKQAQLETEADVEVDGGRILPGLALATGLMMGEPAQGMEMPGMPPQGKDPSDWVHKDQQLPKLDLPVYRGEPGKPAPKPQAGPQRPIPAPKKAHKVWNIGAQGTLERKVPEMGREAEDGDAGDEMQPMGMPTAPSMMGQTASMYVGGREIVGKITRVASTGEVDLAVGDDTYTNVDPGFLSFFALGESK